MKTTTILEAAQASEFLAAIPALLGFQPSDSAVVVPFRGNRTAGAMRFDLPDAAHAQNLASVAAGLVCKIEGATGLVVVIYGTAEQATPVSNAITAHAATCGLDVLDALYVVGTEWARVGERALSAIAEVPAHIAAMAAEADQQAGATLPEVDAALVAEVAESIPDDAAVALALTGGDLIDMIEEALTFDVAAGDAAQAAALIAGLNRPALRDVALVQWAQGEATGAEALDAQIAWQSGAEYPARLASVIWGEGTKPDAERLRAALSVCRHLAALAPEGAATGPLAAAAWLSWALGRSTHADAYVRRALAVDPEHGLSQIIAAMIAAGHLPEWAFTR